MLIIYLVRTAIEEQVVALVITNPALGQVKVSNELKKKEFSVSADGVLSIYLQTFQLCLKALEAKVALESYILTELQLVVLEKTEEEKVRSTGHLFVGNIKGVGHIYLQTFIDTYSKVAFTKLMTGRMLW